MTETLDLGLREYARLKDVLPQLAHLISRKTMERRLVEGLVPSAAKGPDGHWIVHVPTLRAWVLGDWPPRDGGSAPGVARQSRPVTSPTVSADSAAARQFERRLAALGASVDPTGAKALALLGPGVIRHWVRVALRIVRKDHGTLQAEG